MKSYQFINRITTKSSYLVSVRRRLFSIDLASSISSIRRDLADSTPDLNTTQEPSMPITYPNYAQIYYTGNFYTGHAS